MSDIALQMTFAQTGVTVDMMLADGDLVIDETLETAVLVSLFTNKRVPADDPLLDAGQYREGWWGDMHPQVAGDQIGSKLWLLNRQASRPQFPALAVEFSEDAYQWMIDDGVVDTGGIAASASYGSSNGIVQDILNIVVDITEPGGGGTVSFKYFYQWQAQRLLADAA